MKIIKSLTEWQQCRSELKGTIGFVPTMGNLHQGHLSLYQRSIQENEITIASIFINPTQFNNAEDFKHYPKTLEQDFSYLEKLGVDYCLLPTQAELYPDHYNYRVTEMSLSLAMEGEHRPGHFDGVLTVVLKLLNMVQATKAYFGEKDYQQYQLVKGMSEALFLTTQIVGCPIIRDEQGLALSSRNNRLNDDELAKARIFAQLFHQRELSVATIKLSLSRHDIEVEYIEEREGRRFAAVFIGSIRLIDNYISDAAVALS